MSQEIIVSNTIFKNYRTPSYGGVICVQRVCLNVFCCYFINNTSTSQAGSIYCTESPIALNKVLFERSHSLTKRDNLWGNAIYIYENNAIISEITVTSCSYSSLECCDTSLFLQSCLAKVEYLNSTFNYGYFGASGISFYSSKANSFVNFTNIIEGFDHNMVQTSHSAVTISNTNIYNSTKIAEAIVYQSAANLFTFISCIFLETGTISFSYYSRSFNAFNCLSDRAFGNLLSTAKNSIKTIQINFKFECKMLFCNSYKNNKNEIKFQSIQSLLFILIS